MIADARPPVIVRCLSARGYEKPAYWSYSHARKHRRGGQHIYRCPFGDHLHLTGRERRTW